MKAQAELVLGRLCHVAGARRPRPSLFVYPGLTAKPWHNASSAPFASWLPALEAATPAIRDEYLAVRAENLPSDYDVDEGDHASGLHRGGDWHWASFIARGERREPMWERCPQTAAALAGVPGLMEGMPFAFAFFSTLRPGSHIAAHTAPANLRLRFHLCLHAPSAATGDANGGATPACAMRVADETRPWEEGRCVVFDDSFEHEVWNRTDEERVVLLFDIWHPDLEPSEIAAIQAMFREVEGMAAARNKSAPS